MYRIDYNNPIHVFFCGIGGISMSGLAEILIDKGFKVSGSDRSSSELTDSLIKNNARVYIGQKAENVTPDIDVFVYTAAIHPDHPEFVRAKELNIPILTRAELLGQIMKNYGLPIAVSGTHGKTTVTSMISEVLMAYDADPTISVGGILDSIKGNIRIGHSDYFITEACEYTNSFLSFYPKASIILNVEEDHLDFFKDIDDIRSSFRKFSSLVPPEGVVVIGNDIPEKDLILADTKARVITFGKDETADYHAENITFDKDGKSHFRVISKDRPPMDFSLSVPGEHNILNALAALAMCDYLNIDREISKRALFAFGGTKRRFEHKGEVNGFTVVDDYAHHPSEIKATLMSAKKLSYSKIWCVFQPHTYSRTKAFLDGFAQALSLADAVILADIYAARETDDLGISSDDIKKRLDKLGTECYYIPGFEEIEKFILKNCAPGDLLITMGAGNVVDIGNDLLKK